MAGNEVHYTILVVEDDRHTRELLTYNLLDAGFQVHSADNGVAALTILRERVVDLIVCDIMLPKMDGFALREELLGDPGLRDIAFLYLTAKTMPEDQIRGLGYGVDEYITKPFNPQVLLARIEAVLARRESFARAAQIDQLTQLLNRQTCERAIRRELERIRRYSATGSLVFLDIDEFKSVNDDFGHAAGDRALVHLAMVLKQNTRRVDIVGRYGGEEFVLFFPETPEPEAMRVLERMQLSFQGVSECEVHRRLSFSAGLAEAPRDGEELEQLCARADAAMYKAKRDGKARIVPWRPSVGELGSTAAS